MATVTRKFRDDFDAWAADRIARGEWTADEIAGLRDMIRTDLMPGPDQLRQGVVVLCQGVTIPATIDDHEERHRLWADYFAAEVEAIEARRVTR